MQFVEVCRPSGAVYYALSVAIVTRLMMSTLTQDSLQSRTFDVLRVLWCDCSTDASTGGEKRHAQCSQREELLFSRSHQWLPDVMLIVCFILQVMLNAVNIKSFSITARCSPFWRCLNSCCSCACHLQVMLNAVNVKSFSAIAVTSGRPAAAWQRTANCTAVALAGLAGLSPLAKRVRGDGSDKLAEKVLHLASCMLEDQVRFTSRCSLRVYGGVVRFVGGGVSFDIFFLSFDQSIAVGLNLLCLLPLHL
jgi:hypothetical protein